MKLADSNGFTLIELMIVVAIISILAAIALPVYLEYTIRTQVSEGLVVSGGAKAAVSEAYSNLGVMPVDNATAGLPAPNQIAGKFVDSVTVVAGALTISYSDTAPQRANAAISGRTLLLTPTPSTTAGSLVWTCSAGTISQQKFLPTICRPATN